MGSNKIGVSKLGLVVSAAVRARLGIRRMSNRELAREMKRGETYVRARVNDEKEWTLNDLEIICELWGLTPAQLIQSVNVDGDIAARVAETKRLARRDDMRLAAYKDDGKQYYMDHDGSEPA